MKFNQVNWKAVECFSRKQELLVEAYKNKDTEKVRHLQISILKDYRITSIAVEELITSGPKTLGLDGIVTQYH
jgi:hypothetical protein